MRIDTAAAATLDNGIEDSAALAGLGITEKQPVLFPKSGRPNVVFHQVIVDLNFGPLGDRHQATASWRARNGWRDQKRCAADNGGIF